MLWVGCPAKSRAKGIGLYFRHAPAPPPAHPPAHPGRSSTTVLRRLVKRMEALQRVKLSGYEVVISELETEQDYLRRAIRYLEE
jgi:hypothetical protein